MAAPLISNLVMITDLFHRSGTQAGRQSTMKRRMAPRVAGDLYSSPKSPRPTKWNTKNAAEASRFSQGIEQRSRYLQTSNRRDRKQQRRRHRLLVHRHGLQRRKLLRPPRVFPRSQRSLQVTEDDFEGRDQRRRLAIPPQRHQPPLRQTFVWANRSEGDQPSGG